VLLLRPPRQVEAVIAPIPAPAEEDIVLPRRAVPESPRPRRRPTVPVRLHLAPRRAPQKESLWVLDAEQTTAFWQFCAAADERLSRRLEAGSVAIAGSNRLIVRTVGKRPPLVLPFAATGYAPDPRLRGLFVPADRVLKPALRPQALVQALGLDPARVVWLEPSRDGSAVPHSAPLSIFGPVAELLEYTAPDPVKLESLPRGEPFPLLRCPSLAGETAPSVRTAIVPLPVSGKEESAEPGRSSGPGWLRRSLAMLTSRLLPARPRPATNSPASIEPPPAATLAGRPVERKIASPDSLLHGHDWTRRRREMEARLFQELPTLGPADRATRWADLAGIYAATGNAADAAVCWMNAVWEAPSPGAALLEQWLAAERRAARLGDQSGGLDRWLSEPARPGLARVVAAYTAWAGFSPTPPAEFPGALRRILAFLDQRFEDLPVRAAWLARLAATHLCDGDVLGLARWRDRVLSRLSDRGPGLDLDEPSFLRFHGTASADRFQIAREWLARVREPALAWVNRHGDSGRLRSPGIDSETEATAAYAQFMLAWGLGCLGERTRSREWAAQARQRLPRSPGPGVDLAGHAVLSELFLHRIKDAQEGRPPKPGLPHELRGRIDELPFMARYSLDRLREHSRILEPLDRVRAYHGLQLKTFWGTDQLGERLFLLAERADPANVEDEADALLRLCSEHSGTATVPRIVLTLLEVAPWLDSSTFLRVLDHLPTAIDWMEAWLASGPWPDAERADCLVRYQAQMIEAACSTAGSHAPGLVVQAIRQLTRRLLDGGVEMRRPLLAAAAPVFRCLRRLRLTDEAETLMQFLDPGASASGEGHAPRMRLGMGIGWFIAGNEDAGTRILNEARDSLFLGAIADRRERTELAIAYAEALGFTPPRIAHGRLEEIFQRPGFEVEVKSSTNRYFTLKPLQLIDTIVRSVVTDEFTLGPAVRGWLDDDEFLIRSRIHRDLAGQLREQGMG
jgi:hypothetical protein